MTGGLGPTKDDITKKALAEYFGSEQILDQELLGQIKVYFESSSIPFVEAPQNQCFIKA